jgi:TIR domain
MTLSETDRRKLWDRAGGRCSICKRALAIGAAPSHQGKVAGCEVRMSDPQQNTTDGLVLPGGFLDSYESYILLCVHDGRLVQERRMEFTRTRLIQLKTAHETEWAVAGSAGDRATGTVSLLVHTAVFLPSSPLHYFLKIWNQTQSAVRVDRVWFATTPEVSIQNDQRQLPAVLEAGELFETWTLTREVPETPRVEYLARALLGDGSVLKSQPNRNVSPAGLVGGGGQPLTVLADSVASINHSGDQLIEKEWDVFVSHASEDKDAVVRPLVSALRERGLRVWYDEFELRLGDSLRRRIDQGIARSAFGVVVLSPAFFAKGWPNYELDGLVTRAVTGEQVLLPL